LKTPKLTAFDVRLTTRVCVATFNPKKQSQRRLQPKRPQPPQHLLRQLNRQHQLLRLKNLRRRAE
jgi:hypothetical protein